VLGNALREDKHQSRVGEGDRDWGGNSPPHVWGYNWGELTTQGDKGREKNWEKWLSYSGDKKQGPMRGVRNKKLRGHR